MQGFSLFVVGADESFNFVLEDDRIVDDSFDVKEIKIIDVNISDFSESRASLIKKAFACFDWSRMPKLFRIIFANNAYLLYNSIFTLIPPCVKCLDFLMCSLKDVCISYGISSLKIRGVDFKTLDFMFFDRLPLSIENIDFALILEREEIEELCSIGFHNLPLSLKNFNIILVDRIFGCYIGLDNTQVEKIKNSFAYFLSLKINGVDA